METPIKGASVTLNHDDYPELRDDIIEGRGEVWRLVKDVTEQVQRYWMNHILELMNSEVLPDDQYDRIKALAERLTIPRI